jgi:formate dehydrogenase subunit gamma
MTKSSPAGSIDRAGDEQRIQSLVDRHLDLPGALLPMLHAIQDDFGYVPEQRRTGDRQGSESVASRGAWRDHLLPPLPQHPPGRHVVQVCRAEACQAAGAMALETHAKKCLGIDFHDTTADGAVTLEAVYCLGNCAVGPSLRVDDDIVGRVKPARFDDIIAAAGGGSMRCGSRSDWHRTRPACASMCRSTPVHCRSVRKRSPGHRHRGGKARGMPAAPDLRARRRHRSAVARRLPRARRPRRACERRSRCAAATSSRRSPTPACAAAAAPASRPASSGRPCSAPPAAQKYIVCNADEGDSGTFADRMLMEGDPFC